MGIASGLTSKLNRALLRHQWSRTSREANVFLDMNTGEVVVKPDTKNPDRMPLCTMAELEDLLVTNRGTPRKRLDRETQEGTPITAERVMEYLEQLEVFGTHMKASERAGISYLAMRVLRRNNSEIDALAADAIERYRESLEHEARRRAVDGWDEPVIGGKFRDEVVAHVRRYDSRLMELMLKRHIPEYRDKYEATINVTAGILVVPSAILDEKEWHLQNAGVKLPERDAIDALPGQVRSTPAPTI